MSKKKILHPTHDYVRDIDWDLKFQESALGMQMRVVFYGVKKLEDGNVEEYVLGQGESNRDSTFEVHKIEEGERVIYDQMLCVLSRERALQLYQDLRATVLRMDPREVERIDYPERDKRLTDLEDRMKVVEKVSGALVPEWKKGLA